MPPKHQLARLVADHLFEPPVDGQFLAKAVFPATRASPYSTKIFTPTLNDSRIETYDHYIV